MKRLLLMLLCLTLIFSMSSPAFAAGAASGDSYTFTAAVNGSQNATVENGSTVTVTLALSKDGAERFDLYSMQDYVRFDPEYFDFVSDSISVYTATTAGNSIPTALLRATALADKDSGIKDRVFVNRAVLGEGIEADTKSGEIMLTFKLKAKKAGQTSITHLNGQVQKTATELYTVTTVPAAVTITSGGSGSGDNTGTGDNTGSGTGDNTGSGTGGYGGAIVDHGVTIKNDGSGITTKLNSYGSKLTITVENGYELVNVTLNGVSKGAVTSLSGLKSGDVVVITSKKAGSGSAGGSLSAIETYDLLSKLTPVARSSRTAKKNTQVVVKLDEVDQAIIEQIEKAGYTVKYNFYRSVKKTSKYKAMYIPSDKTYVNTIGVKGTMYYYKVRVQVYDGDGTLVARTQLKQCKYANRLWIK